jgi:hypothetical protein
MMALTSGRLPGWRIARVTCLSAAIAISAGSCQDAPTGVKDHDLSVPLHDEGGGAPLPPNAEVGIMPAQASSMEFYPWTDFGAPFPEPTYVEITVVGSISTFYGPYEYRFGEDVGKFWKTLDARGWYNTSTNSCGAGVKVGFSLSGGVDFCMGNNAEPVLPSRSMKVIAKGQAKMWRNKGPWLAGCNNYSYNPCFTLAGTQTITVAPTSDKLQLAASATEVRSGDSVTFTASTTNGAAFTIRQWIWVDDASDNPPVIRRIDVSTGVSLRVRHQGESARASFDGGSGQPACSTTSNMCTVTVSHSGTMYVNAWVVSKVEQAKASVDVQPPDLVVYCSAPPATESGGNSITRVDPVICVGRLEPEEPFELILLAASAQGNQYTAPSTNSLYGSYGSGDSIVWSGPAVVSTTVSMTARITSGVEVTGSGSFSVSARNWPTLVMPPAPTPQSTSASPPLESPVPLIDSAGYDVQPIKGALGVNDLPRRVGGVAYGNEGPNTPWWYMSTAPVFGNYSIYYSSWLDDSSAFAMRQQPQQPGEPPPQRYSRYCETEDVTDLRVAVLQHEGAPGSPGPSHHTVRAQFVNATNAVPQLEAHVVFMPLPEDEASGFPVIEAVKAQVEAFWRSVFTDPETAMNDSFDNSNPVPLPSCKFRF